MSDPGSRPDDRPSGVPEARPDRLSSGRWTSPATLAFWGIGITLLAGWAAFVPFSWRFGYDTTVFAMPVRLAVVAFVAAGALFALLFGLLLRRNGGLPMGSRTALVMMFAIGIGMRAVLFASEPLLEDDYQRYLWDGAVTAQGMNPYAIAPEQAKTSLSSTPIGELAERSGELVGRINHPELRTVYPPVAQGAFALAHVISPFSLSAWRAVILASEVLTFGLIVALLVAVGRAPLWAVLYWWNPLVTKELLNSAHMEAILLPMVLGAILFAVHNRRLAATALLGLAVGTKIWPAFLLPLIWRPLLDQPRRLLACIAIFATLALAWIAPVVMAGLDETSGFVAYAENWKTNALVFGVLEYISGHAVTMLAMTGVDGGELLTPGRLARLFVLTAMGAAAIALAWEVAHSQRDLVARCAILIATVVLLSPAQFPWYMTWFLPFLPLYPSIGFAAMALTMPFYYLAFYHMARDTYEAARPFLIAAVWLPLLPLLAYDAMRMIKWGRWRDSQVYGRRDEHVSVMTQHGNATCLRRQTNA